MKALPFTEYMKELRKVYNRESKKKVRSYVFTSKKLRKMEDLYQMRNKDLEAGKIAAVHPEPKRTYSKE